MKWCVVCVGAIAAVALAALLLVSAPGRRSSSSAPLVGLLRLVGGARPESNGSRPAAAPANASRPALYVGLDAATLVDAAVSPSGANAAFRVLALVHSRVDNARGRDAVRRSYGSVARVGDVAVRTVFVVGRSVSPAVDRAVREEGARFGDVVQFDFADTYPNLTLKTVLGLRWATAGLQGGGGRAEYVLKVDEDVLVNYDRLLAYLAGASRDRLYAGYVWSGALPFRNPSSKYYVSVEEYAGELYPDYAAGPCYVLSADAARLVVERAPSLPFLTMEDVFVGICADHAGVKATHAQGFGNELASEYDYCKFRSMITVHGVGADWKERYWRDRTAALHHVGPSC